MSIRAYLDHHSAPVVQPGEGEKALEQIYRELGAAKQDQFFLCSSGAEAINGVLLSHYFDSVRETGKNHIVTTNIEEAPTLLSLSRLEQLGCGEKILSVNVQGQITREMLVESLRPRTSLVSLSWANGLTGVIHPIADLAEVCREKGVRLHVDASYVIGKLFFRFEDLPIDFLTFDGQLIGAPQGIGGMLAKAGTPFHPLVLGQNRDTVSRLESVANALVENSSHFDHLNLETARLRDQLEQGILAGFPEAHLFFRSVERLPNCSVIGFPGVIGEALLYLLQRRGVYATLGGGRTQKLSHVLIASGVDEVLAQCALSFSLSFGTTEAEIAHAVEVIVHSAQQLRACSAGIFEVAR